MLSRTCAGGCEQDRFDPLYGFHQVLVRVGVAEADVSLAVCAERGAAEAGHTGFVQQEIGGGFRVHTGSGDVGEGVEGARRGQVQRRPGI